VYAAQTRTVTPLLCVSLWQSAAHIINSAVFIASIIIGMWLLLLSYAMSQCV
jgi:hypothetical protein